ncbi:hypothetical protein CCUS01_12852 [Colletotrichum cuscutae]|uniref:Uncharacterized protein n=1 Tax=Colletotrichum cuscutae TaxID=1209917 RepID=A0AAI9YD65_9PEZI|nr:hypothetical protein CCUS01_12852 [Colletotrichum cuscutae]
MEGPPSEPREVKPYRLEERTRGGEIDLLNIMDQGRYLSVDRLPLRLSPSPLATPKSSLGNHGLSTIYSICFPAFPGSFAPKRVGFPLQPCVEGMKDSANLPLEKSSVAMRLAGLLLLQHHGLKKETPAADQQGSLLVLFPAFSRGPTSQPDAREALPCLRPIFMPQDCRVHRRGDAEGGEGNHGSGGTFAQIVGKPQQLVWEGSDMTGSHDLPEKGGRRIWKDSMQLERLSVEAWQVKATQERQRSRTSVSYEKDWISRLGTLGEGTDQTLKDGAWAGDLCVHGTARRRNEHGDMKQERWAVEVKEFEVRPKKEHLLLPRPHLEVGDVILFRVFAPGTGTRLATSMIREEDIAEPTDACLAVCLLLPVDPEPVEGRHAWNSHFGSFWLLILSQPERTNERYPAKGLWVERKSLPDITADRCLKSKSSPVFHVPENRPSHRVSAHLHPSRPPRKARKAAKPCLRFAQRELAIVVSRMAGCMLLSHRLHFFSAVTAAGWFMHESYFAMGERGRHGCWAPVSLRLSHDAGRGQVDVENEDRPSLPCRFRVALELDMLFEFKGDEVVSQRNGPCGKSPKKAGGTHPQWSGIIAGGGENKGRRSTADIPRSSSLTLLLGVVPRSPGSKEGNVSMRAHHFGRLGCFYSCFLDYEYSPRELGGMMRGENKIGDLLMRCSQVISAAARRTLYWGEAAEGSATRSHSRMCLISKKQKLFLAHGKLVYGTGYVGREGDQAKRWERGGSWQQAQAGRTGQEQTGRGGAGNQ